MGGMFYNAAAFNGDVSGWNVSGVTSMWGMFYNAAEFNGDVSGWNVSGVTSMWGMFYNAAEFNGDVSGWNVSSVTDMTGMFQGAAAFEQNLGKWYIVLNGTDIDAGDAPGVVGAISAQNRILDGQNPTYDIADGRDSFEIVNGTFLNMTVAPTQPLYMVTINSTGDFGTGNHHRAYNVTVTGLDTDPDTTPPADTLVLAVSATDNFQDATNLDTPEGIDTFTQNGRTYAVVAATESDAVQVIDVTDPYDITATDRHADSTNLDGVGGVKTFDAGDHTYAVATANAGNAVRVLNVTDPGNIALTGGIRDGGSLLLGNPRQLDVFVSGGRTYAAVASYSDGGVQVIDVTDPGNVTAAGSIVTTDNPARDRVVDVETFKIGDHTYAVMTAQTRDAVRVLNLTDPGSITLTDSLIDTTSIVIDNPNGIAIFDPGDGRTYAAVASSADDGVQIIDVTDPSDIRTKGSLQKSNTALLDGATDLASFVVGGSTYLAVTAFTANAVQVIDVTDPDNIAAAGSIAKGDGILLDGAQGIGTFYLDGVPYAAATADNDHAVQILRLADTAPVYDPAAFVTTWETTGANGTITIPVDGATGNYTVHWGDGNSTTHVTDATHAYAEGGNHTVSISGNFTKIYLAGDQTPTQKSSHR